MSARSIFTGTGGADQHWDLVDPASGKTALTGTGTPVHVRQRSSGLLLDVPHCAHAAFPVGPGPPLDVVNASSTSSGEPT